MDAHADPSARWAQIHTVGFPMVGLNSYIGSRRVGTFSTQYNNACDSASQEICYFQVMRGNELLHVYLDYLDKN